MRYRVNAPGVEHVLKRTGAQTDEFADDLDPLQKGVPTAVSALGSSGIVIGALDTFLQAENSRMTSMVTRAEGCLTGAVLATLAYVHGDLAMMKTAQDNAAKAKISHVPARWLKK